MLEFPTWNRWAWSKSVHKLCLNCLTAVRHIMLDIMTGRSRGRRSLLAQMPNLASVGLRSSEERIFCENRSLYDILFSNFIFLCVLSSHGQVHSLFVNFFNTSEWCRSQRDDRRGLRSIKIPLEISNWMALKARQNGIQILQYEVYISTERASTSVRPRWIFKSVCYLAGCKSVCKFETLRLLAKPPEF